MDGGWGGIKSEGNKGKRSGRGGVWWGFRTIEEGTVYEDRLRHTWEKSSSEIFHLWERRRYGRLKPFLSLPTNSISTWNIHKFYEICNTLWGGGQNCKYCHNCQYCFTSASIVYIFDTFVSWGFPEARAKIKRWRGLSFDSWLVENNFWPTPNHILELPSIHIWKYSSITRVGISDDGLLL